MSKDTMTLAEFREKKRETEEAIEKILNDFINKMSVGVENVYVYDKQFYGVTMDGENYTGYQPNKKTCTIVVKL